MVAWQNGDGIILAYNGADPPNPEPGYLRVFEPDGTLRGEIFPSGLDPQRSYFTGQPAIRFSGNRAYFQQASSLPSGSDPRDQIFRCDQDGLAELVEDLTEASDDSYPSGNGAGIAFDGVGNLYYFLGSDPLDADYFKIRKRDANLVFVQDYTYHVDDVNLRGGGDVEAYTIAVNQEGTILYFFSTAQLLGTFFQSSNANNYGLNRLDLITGTTMPSIPLQPAVDMIFAGLTTRCEMLPFYCYSNGDIGIGMWDTTSNPDDAYWLVITADGLYVRHHQLLLVSPNEAGIGAEAENFALNEADSLVWTNELGGPMTIYEDDGTATIAHRWSHADNINDIGVSVGVALVFGLVVAAAIRRRRVNLIT